MSNGPQLITYPDSLGGSLAAIDDLMSGDLRGVFPGGVHVLPPFPSSGDRGFAPMRYDVIDPVFGTEDDLRRLARHGGLTLDLMVNHISARSPQFQDFLRRGRASEWADLFITVEKVFTRGNPSPRDLAPIARRRPSGPLLDVVVAAARGRETHETVWATFSDRRTGACEQIDIDLRSPVARELAATWFEQLRSLGATTVRLDAVGYVTKREGTSCFMVEPDIWDRLAELHDLAARAGVDLLVEVHGLRATHQALVGHGYRSYDFVLPALVLHALASGDAATLAAHLRQSPSHQVTALDTHDGIPILPDMTGVLPDRTLQAIVDRCVEQGANVSRLITAPSGSLDAHQVNITYRDAVAGDAGYLAARAIQLFAPGIPQIYYVGLLGGHSDQAAYAATGDGRAVNRHDYTPVEIREALGSPLVRQLVDLIRLRAAHPAFEGNVAYSARGGTLTAQWTHGSHSAGLSVDLADPYPRVEAS